MPVLKTYKKWSSGSKPHAHNPIFGHHPSPRINDISVIASEETVLKAWNKINTNLRSQWVVPVVSEGRQSHCLYPSLSFSIFPVSSYIPIRRPRIPTLQLISRRWTFGIDGGTKANYVVLCRSGFGAKSQDRRYVHNGNRSEWWQETPKLVIRRFSYLPCACIIEHMGHDWVSRYPHSSLWSLTLALCIIGDSTF